VYSCQHVRWLLSSSSYWPFSLHWIHCCQHWQPPHRRRVLNASRFVSSPAQDIAFPLVYKPCKCFNRLPSTAIRLMCVILDWCCFYRGNTFFCGIWYFPLSYNVLRIYLLNYRICQRLHMNCVNHWYYPILRDLRISDLRSNQISNRIGREDLTSNRILESNLFNSNEY